MTIIEIHAAIKNVYQQQNSNRTLERVPEAIDEAINSVLRNLQEEAILAVAIRPNSITSYQGELLNIFANQIRNVNITLTKVPYSFGNKSTHVVLQDVLDSAGYLSHIKSTIVVTIPGAKSPVSVTGSYYSTTDATFSINSKFSNLKLNSIPIIHHPTGLTYYTLDRYKQINSCELSYLKQIPKVQYPTQQNGGTPIQLNVPEAYHQSIVNKVVTHLKLSNNEISKS